jgi:rod shape-determining protein MreB and related proteins
MPKETKKRSRKLVGAGAASHQVKFGHNFKKEKESAMDQGIVLIGMDLGSYKTSVASSTGTRDTFLSAVGWPKDQIARRMLGRDVVVGNDTVRHRLALDVIRPFEKGLLKYCDDAEAGLSPETIEKHKEAARRVVEYAVALMRAPKGTLIYGVIGAPSRASKLKRKMLIDVAKNAFDAVLIVSEPFTIAYGMDWLTDTLVIDIGAGTIDLCPVFGTFPSEDNQVTVPLGGDFIDQRFHETMAAEHPEIKLSLNMAREIKENYGFVHDNQGPAVVTLPVAGTPKQYDVTEKLRSACAIIVPPIIEAINELVARFDTEFQQRLLNNIVLGGGGSQLRGLDRAIEDALRQYSGGKVRKVSDAVFAGANGALKLAKTMPPESWTQVAYQHEEATKAAA